MFPRLLRLTKLWSKRDIWADGSLENPKRDEINDVIIRGGTREQYSHASTRTLAHPI